MSNSLLVIDQGTTSTRAILFNELGNILKSSQLSLQQIYPNDGWVEHDPEEIWQKTLQVLISVIDLGLVKSSSLKAIGITNQRETTVIWDKTSSEPIYNAIVWQDRRTAKMCSQLKQEGYEELVREKTGLLLDPYFSATKIAWILDNVPGAREKSEQGRLAFGTIDSFLLWRLTKGKVHATDATNASRTLLFNIKTQEWDQELLKLFRIPHNILPKVQDSVSEFGISSRELVGHSIPITGIAGDQQAAAIGQGCVQKGGLKMTFGTGGFALLNTGSDIVYSKNNLLTTTALRFNNQALYALEGSVFIAGAVVQWLRDNLNIVQSAKDTESLAKSVKSTNGVVFVPAFTGLGAPYWNPNVRGAILGLKRDTTKAHIVRAALEAVCFQTKDLYDALIQDSGVLIQSMKVDGGMTVNNWMCQYLADLLGINIIRPKVVETTAIGAAFLAGLGVGVFSKLEEIDKVWQLDQCFNAEKTRKIQREYANWQQSIKLLNI